MPLVLELLVLRCVLMEESSAGGSFCLGRVVESDLSFLHGEGKTCGRIALGVMTYCDDCCSGIVLMWHASPQNAECILRGGKKGFSILVALRSVMFCTATFGATHYSKFARCGCGRGTLCQAMNGLVCVARDSPTTLATTLVDSLRQESRT